MTSAAIGMTGPPGRRIVRSVAGILRRSTGTDRRRPDVGREPRDRREDGELLRTPRADGSKLSSTKSTTIRPSAMPVCVRIATWGVRYRGWMLREDARAARPSPRAHRGIADPARTCCCSCRGPTAPRRASGATRRTDPIIMRPASASGVGEAPRSGTIPERDELDGRVDRRDDDDLHDRGRRARRASGPGTRPPAPGCSRNPRTRTARGARPS